MVIKSEKLIMDVPLEHQNEDICESGDEQKLMKRKRDRFKQLIGKSNDRFALKIQRFKQKFHENSGHNKKVDAASQVVVNYGTCPNSQSNQNQLKLSVTEGKFRSHILHRWFNSKSCPKSEIDEIVSNKNKPRVSKASVFSATLYDGTLIIESQNSSKNFKEVNPIPWESVQRKEKVSATQSSSDLNKNAFVNLQYDKHPAEKSRLTMEGSLLTLDNTQECSSSYTVTLSSTFLNCLKQDCSKISSRRELLLGSEEEELSVDCSCVDRSLLTDSFCQTKENSIQMETSDNHQCSHLLKNSELAECSKSTSEELLSTRNENTRTVTRRIAMTRICDL